MMKYFVLFFFVTILSKSYSLMRATKWSFRQEVAVEAQNKLNDYVIDGDLTPLNNNILVRVKDAVISTSGGLFIPDNAKERPTEGIGLIHFSQCER